MAFNDDTEYIITKSNTLFYILYVQIKLKVEGGPQLEE